MLKAVHGQKNPKYSNCFVLFVRGYFGDSDEYFNEEISSGGHIYSNNALLKTLEEKEEYIESAYIAYEYMKNNSNLEERCELPEEYREYIQGSSQDNSILPSAIEELELAYFDNNGKRCDVEII